jgi:hypothetical protein
VGLRWPSLLLVAAAIFELVLTLAQVQPANAVDQSRLAVDGLPLGAKVRTDSSIYKQYDCAASTQYRELTYCKRVKTDTKNGGKLTTTTTIMHSGDGTVAYVNQFIEPTSFTRADIDTEIARLSAKFGEKARLLEAPVQPGLPKAVIATWGSVKLIALSDADLAVLRSSYNSPGKGILVDYLGDFTRSARAGFPVYNMQGEFGYVWIVNYDDQGRGTLRFLAVNAATLSAAFAGSQTPQPRQPNSTIVVAPANQEPAAKPAGPTFADDQVIQIAEQLLESVFACPTPMETFNEADQPVQSIGRMSFSGGRTDFVLTERSRMLSDVGAMFDGPSTGPSETHMTIVTNANYADLASVEIDDDHPQGWHGGPALRVHCRSKQKCFYTQKFRDTGPQRMRHEDYRGDEAYFSFCDATTRDNAKAAFDALIATASPPPPQLTTRTVKPAAGGYINLREGPGLDRNVIVQIPAGDTIAVDEAGCKPGSDGRTTFPFCPVTWKGWDGWASSSGFN